MLIYHWADGIDGAVQGHETEVRLVTEALSQAPKTKLRLTTLLARILMDHVPKSKPLNNCRHAMEMTMQAAL